MVDSFGGWNTNYLKDDTFLSRPLNENSSLGVIGQRSHSTNQFSMSELRRTQPSRPKTVSIPSSHQNSLDYRYVSEQARIDQLFSTLRFEKEEFENATELTATPRNDDPIFEDDLVKVKTWFTKDLTEDQRLATVLTLLNDLPNYIRSEISSILNNGSSTTPLSTITSATPPPTTGLFGDRRRGMVTLEAPVPIRKNLMNFDTNQEQFLPQIKHDSKDYYDDYGFVSENFGHQHKSSYRSHNNNLKYGWAKETIDIDEYNYEFGGQYTNHSTQHQEESTPPRSNTASLSSSPISLHPGGGASSNITLFHTDIHAWLRHHRLHKYGQNFQNLTLSMSRSQILDLTDKDLEAFGIVALGARNKILRLFDMIKQELPK